MKIQVNWRFLGGLAAGGVLAAVILCAPGRGGTPGLAQTLQLNPFYIFIIVIVFAVLFGLGWYLRG